MNKKQCILFALVVVAPLSLLGQEKPPVSATPAAPPANPITVSEKGLYSFMSSAVIRAAEKMPEEDYSFKPTPEVRSFGQLVGHVADANYMFCSQASGEANPMKNVEKTEDFEGRSRGLREGRSRLLRQGLRQYDGCQGQ